MSGKLKILVILLSLAVVSSPIFAQKEAEVLFRSNDTVNITISAPWRDFRHDDEAEWWPATLSWKDDDGQQQSLDLTIERRGISRQRMCSLAPVKLRFEDRVKQDGLFKHQKSLKMVTHCKDKESWQQYYILEMLAYRIYNLMTDYSFRVRPFEVVYDDVDSNKQPETWFAFVIEDDKAVAKRHGLKKLKVDSTRPGRLDPLEASRLAVFQMMIGNLDWSPLTGPDDGCCHNAKLIGDDPLADPVIAIPYDFDSTGLVSPSYAKPPAQLPVRSIRQRLYRGYCAHSQTLDQVRAQLQDQRGEIYALFEDEQRLSNRSRKKALKYLDSFYEILDSDKEFQQEIVDACRG